MPSPRVADVLLALEQAFGARGWHGPTVLESIADVKAAEAKRRPARAHHSIHELVDHIQYWEEVGCRYFTSRGLPKQTRPDWARPTLSFARSVRRLKATHARLVKAVASLRDADLARQLPTWGAGRVSLAKLLHGIAAHDAYHAGQIGIVKALLRSR